MTIPELENLVRVGQIKSEPCAKLGGLDRVRDLGEATSRPGARPGSFPLVDWVKGLGRGPFP